MCGIFGFTGINDKSLLRKMSHIMNHRGPDEQGFYEDKNVMLGNNRLSIIDLDSGKQPMSDENNELVIVFNGEIYNYREIRKDLEKKYSFRTNSDTEVILLAYKEFGYNCLEKFNGMFAFAILDKRKNILFIARDRMGIKPLYYTIQDKNLIFSSEMKAILLYDEIKRELNYEAINNFLTFRYNSEAETILRNIFKLQPGHYLISHLGDNNNKPKVEITKYWDFEYLDLGAQEKPIDFYAAKVRDLLSSAVKRRLVSDVPVSALLSGGLDSSSVVALMSKYKTNQKTFIIGFEGEKDNEYEYAQLVAKRFKTDHHELVIKPQKLDLLPKIIWHMDEPVGDLTTIPLYAVFKEARKHSKVILMGDGGDEVFAGYEQTKILQKSQMYNKFLPRIFGKQIIPSFFNLLPKEPALIKLKSFLKNQGNIQFSYMDLMSVFNKDEKKDLYSKKSKCLEHIDSDVKMIGDYFKGNHYFLDKVLRTELKSWFVEDILLRGDRLAMAHSLEGRVPFVDHELVEFSAKIPFKYKLKGFNEKLILKKAMSGILPKEIILRKKQRFTTMIDTWFGDELINISHNLLYEKNDINSCFNKRYLDNLLDYRNKLSYKYLLKGHKLTRQYYARQIWCLLTLNVWNKLFMEDIAPNKVFNRV